MKNILEFIFSPPVFTVLLVEWAIRIAMLFVVPHRRKPSSANSWLLLIFVSPVIGTLVFYMFGHPKLPKHRRQNRRIVDAMTQRELKHIAETNADLLSVIQNDDHDTLARLASVLGGLPAMGGNNVDFIADYQSVYKDMIKEIDRAKEYIHIEYFIATFDDATRDFFEALERAGRRGVKIRFLYDRVASRAYPGHKRMRKFFAENDIECHEMLPLHLVPGKRFTRPDLRNHRKIVVIDGRVAYSGSQNLIHKSYHRRDGIYYEEVVAKLQGPIVWQYNNIFRADWYAETGDALVSLVEEADLPKWAGPIIAQVLPSGPLHDHDNNLKFYTSMVHSAKKRVGIVVPYFIPDESFLDALTAAAQRGVDVTMINSAAIDKILAGHAQRSYYEELLEAGVKIYLYKAPVFLHAKQVLIDDQVAILGSSNLDIRSFELDLEVTTILYDKLAAKKLEAIESDYLQRSRKITLKTWRKRPVRVKMLESLARLTAALQ